MKGGRKSLEDPIPIPINYKSEEVLGIGHGTPHDQSQTRIPGSQVVFTAQTVRAAKQPGRARPSMFVCGRVRIKYFLMVPELMIACKVRAQLHAYARACKTHYPIL